jgi:restriction system protein
MPIPDYQTIMLPLLTFASDRREHSARESIDHLGQEFALSDAERKELLTSGQQTFDNRVGWALTYLKRLGSSRRRVVATTGSPSVALRLLDPGRPG